MAVIMTIGLIPMGSVIVKADTKNATLSNLGELGTVKIGNKSESGTWYQTEIAGTPVFCMDLGKACHAGDVYVSSDDTYSSNSSNAKKANEAKIGYWYSVTKEKSTKAWVYAQALMWSCEEGNTSKNNLTDVISQVRKNTGYYNSKSAADLYDEIFGITTTVTCNVKIWKYGGSGEYRQVLMEIKGGPVEYDFERINDTLVYRQRITIDKTDEDGNPVARVPFEVTAQNYKELYDYKVNGWGNAETGDADGDSVFSSVAETDSKGRITYKFNYQIQSKNYGYVKASDLKNMTADDKKAVKEKMDDKNITYASNLTQTGAKELMQADLDAQMKKISNQYAVKEVGAGSDDMLVNSEYENGEAGNGSYVSEDGKGSLDENADVAGNKRAMDDAGINGMNPDNAKADALNGVNPLGDGGSMTDKTSRMDKELDMESATSTFNGNGERGVLSSKSDLAGKYGKTGANSGFTSRAGDNFGKTGANNHGTGTKGNAGISHNSGMPSNGGAKSSNKKASESNAAQKLKKDVLKNK